MPGERGTARCALAVVVFGALASALGAAGCDVGADDIGPPRPRRDAGAPGADAGMTPPGGFDPTESCGNGVDDDRDGQIDEDCPCTAGETQPCFAGPPTSAGIGQCQAGTQRCEGAGEGATWGACEGAVGPGDEVCDDMVDNNCNGVADDGCTCAAGTTRPCYEGPHGTQDVGACRAGSQRCVDSGPDGATEWHRVCDEQVLPTTGEVCGNMVDDDCNGMVDDGCPCPACGCPPGQTATWERVMAMGAGSGVTAGGAPLWRMTCLPGMTCGRDQVAVRSGGATATGPEVICTPPPPRCPMGQELELIGGELRCVPCDVVVQYGFMFGFQRVCAGRPMLMCRAGQVPTFVYETRRWECRPTCDNDEYDQVMIAGMLVCVPC